MAKMTKEEMLKLLDDNIYRIKDKDFNIYFFVLDTKGNPSSSLEYIYQTAYVLHSMGYNVKLLHQEKDFVGVADWLEEKYASLPHANVDKDNVEITPSDILVVPEIFANVILQTKKLPCKKVILVQNYNHITEFMPVSVSLEELGITDAIVTTKVQESKFQKYFPNVRTHIVSPSIKKLFRKSDNLKKLIINVVCKDQTIVNRIVKPFYWENPIYKWVTFRDLRGLTMEDFAKGLDEAAITVWVDDETNFGYTLLEALRCGGIVLAKVPNHPSDWMMENGDLNPNIIWFNDIDDIPSMLSSLVRTWTMDEVPDEVYALQSKLSTIYSEEKQREEITDVYIHGIIQHRLEDFEAAKKDVENNVDKAKEE